LRLNPPSSAKTACVGSGKVINVAMLPLSALSSMKVMIATPCYAAGCTSPYVASLFNLSAQVVGLGLPCKLELLSESLITRARNRLVAKFLQDETLTHLFCIDADVGFSTEAALRLLLVDRDVVAGVYPLKRYDWPEAGLPAAMTREQFEHKYTPYPVNAIDGRLRTDPEGFGEVAEATTGFMCIKREVFRRLIDAYPELEYVPEDYVADRRFHWLFFDCMKDQLSGRYLSEDYAFCKRWRDIGGQVWVDINSALSHQGQHVYRGDLVAHLRAKYPSPIIRPN